jgi:hypothetical protein
LTRVNRDRLPRTGRARVAAAALGLLRLGLGAGLAVRPELVPRMLGVDAVSARRMSWQVRMTAVRDAALGAGGLQAAVTGEGLRPWLLAQAVADAGDAVAVGLAVRARQVSPLAAGAVGGTAVCAVVWGLLAARDAAVPSRRV